MKRYILSLLALVATMSIQAQVVKVYKNGTLTETYTNTATDKYKVVFEEYVDPNLLPGEFSVSATKKVKFTKGNLQATYSTSTKSYTWGFAAHQWDYIGGKASSGSTTGNNTIGNQTNNAIVDLFSWSTTASLNNWGIQTSVNSNNNEYTKGNFKDWGLNFEGKGYYTLLLDEWKYLLNTSNATSGARTQTNRFAKANVKGVKGLLIFPDNYNGTTPVSGTGIAAVNSANADYPTSQIPDGTWTTMESSGVVFLPVAGYRYGDDVRGFGTAKYHATYFFGAYWSSSEDTQSLIFCYNDITFSNNNRYDGRSVRLVKTVSE